MRCVAVRHRAPLRGAARQRIGCERTLYTERLSSAKLLPHYGAQRLITAPA